MVGQLLLFAFALAGSQDASLLVATVPPGMEVWVDGAWRGRSPVWIHGLAPGPRSLRVAAATWAVQPVESLLVLEPGTTRVRLVMPATLHLVSEPPGAVVCVDGRPVGRCPLVLSLTPPGPYAISLRHADTTASAWEWAPLAGTCTTVWARPRLLPREPRAPQSRRLGVVAGLSSVAMAVGSVVAAHRADEAYESYRRTANPGLARALFRRAQRMDRWASGLWAGFEVSIVALLVWSAAR